MVPRVSLVPGRARALLAALRMALVASALALGCSSDEDAPDPSASSCDHSLKDLVGGWQSRFSLRACFAADQRMWIGDTEYDTTQRSHCTTSADGCRYDCTDLGGGEPYGGTLELVGDQLRVSNDDCPLEPDRCGTYYVRSTAITCQQ